MSQQASESTHETILLSTGSTSHVWRTPTTTTRATIVLQHGFCEYAERYLDSHHSIIRKLNNAGYTVRALDMWGHGQSPGTRGVTHVGKAVTDHVELRKLASKDGLPVILFGHSLGGLVTAGSVTASSEDINGVIMMGPALPELPWFARVAVGMLARSLPGVSVPLPEPGLDGLTRDLEEQKRFTSDPRIQQRQVPFLLAATALCTMQQVSNGLHMWKVPTLVLHGSGDTFTRWQGSQRFVAGVASDDKTFRKYEEGRHELLNDSPVADEALREILTWIQMHI
jgi:acylglycerol lipase